GRRTADSVAAGREVRAVVAERVGARALGWLLRRRRAYRADARAGAADVEARAAVVRIARGVDALAAADRVLTRRADVDDDHVERRRRRVEWWRARIRRRRFGAAVFGWRDDATVVRTRVVVYFRERAAA